MPQLSYLGVILLSILCALGSAATPKSAMQTNGAALNETLRLFNHAYGGYMYFAFPFDELKPTSCSGTDAYFHGMALTLVDSLDSLAVLGLRQEFAHAVERVRVQFLKSNGFDIDENVSVFESNIRLLGGLISAHILAVDDNRGILKPVDVVKQENIEFQGPSKKKDTQFYHYDGKHLLELAHDLGRRLLPAFNTRTGIPYGTVNLRNGVPSDETPITCTACGGSFLLEFAALSRLTGDQSFEHAAHRATVALIQHRDPDTGLLGSHINVLTGEWTEKVCV
jgi:mannosidase alpha-like ER degradation enhancer 2